MPKVPSSPSSPVAVPTVSSPSAAMSIAPLPQPPIPSREDRLAAIEKRASTSTAAQDTATLEDQKKRKIKMIEFSRLLDKDIIGGNSYSNAYDCVSTLILIGSNILNDPTNPKFSAIKETNGMLQKKVLFISGGKEYLVMMGFRTRVVSMSQSYVFHPTPITLPTLQLGVNALKEKLQLVTDRFQATKKASISAKQEEAARISQALRNIEDDRLSVQERVARESIINRLPQKKENKEDAIADDVDDNIDNNNHDE